MFVRKSAHDVVVAQRDEARASAERMNEGLSRLRRGALQDAVEIGRLSNEVQQLRADLAASYIRNAKGQIVRHPSAAA